MSKTITITFTKQHFEKHMGHPIKEFIWEIMATQIPWMYIEDIEEGYWNTITDIKQRTSASDDEIQAWLDEDVKTALLKDAWAVVNEEL
jgi:hypothetical protein